MRESKVRNGLIMQWVPVVDAQGRTRMEAVWVNVSARPVAVQAA